MSARVIIIGGEFRKNPLKVLFVDHDQMIGALAPDRPDQAFSIAVLKGSQLHAVRSMGCKPSGSRMCSIRFTGASLRWWTNTPPGERTASISTMIPEG